MIPLFFFIISIFSKLLLLSTLIIAETVKVCPLIIEYPINGKIIKLDN